MTQEVEREKEELVKKSPKPSPKPEWRDEVWAVDHKIQKFFPIPYSKKEVFRWFFNRIFGPSKRYKKKTHFIHHESELNVIKPDYKIGFVGDIMKMFSYELEFHQSIKNFFNDVELIVGNLEGILTLQPGWIIAQRHNIDIVQQLSTIKPPEQWLLCLSNNHSGDFGIDNFSAHLDRLQQFGFRVFGRKDISKYDYKKLNFVVGSRWINQKGCKYIARFDEIDKWFKDDMFNILYPHWNYEYELYPRPKIRKKSNKLIKKWDLIFGHHPHVVQPITCVRTSDINKILAYSAGNFSSGFPNKAHRYGLIMKCEIGPLIYNTAKLAVGKMEWKFTKSEWDGTFKLKKKKKIPIPGIRPNMLVKVSEENEIFPNLEYVNIDSL